MTGQKETENNLESIDFKNLILTLWHGKWIILVTALICGLIVFLLSSYVIPVKYRASTVIHVTVRNTWIELIEKGISQIARSDEMLDLTYAELGITDPEKQRSLEFVAYMEYWGQLQLDVIAGDPELAAKAANVWADLVYDRIFAVFGTSDEFMYRLEEEVAQAEASWYSATSDLNDRLSGSRLEIYPEQLTEAKAAFAAYRNAIDRNRLILSDAQTLEGQIEDMNPSESLAQGMVLNLINLLGRAGELAEEPESLSLDDSSLNLDMSSTQALGILQQFQTALENQNQQLEKETAILEDNISFLAVSLKMEQDQIDDLTLKRDLARTNYQELSAQFTDFMILKNQVDQSVSVSSRAKPPTEVNAPSIVASVGFTVVSAALVTMLVLLFFDWWRV